MYFQTAVSYSFLNYNMKTKSISKNCSIFYLHKIPIFLNFILSFTNSISKDFVIYFLKVILDSYIIEGVMSFVFTR